MVMYSTGLSTSPMIMLQAPVELVRDGPRQRPEEQGGQQRGQPARR